MLGNLLNVSVTPDLFLTDLREGEEDVYVEYMKDKEIYDATLRIPYPYTRADALWWLGFNRDLAAKGKHLHWALRNAQGVPLGGIGFNSDIEIGTSHQSEIGYWLAKKFWGQGIMTAAVKKLCEIGFGPYRLTRLYATVMDFNEPSFRVLEKVGFTNEGLLRKYYHKDGKFIDARMYALVK